MDLEIISQFDVQLIQELYKSLGIENDRNDKNWVYSPSALYVIYLSFQRLWQDFVRYHKHLSIYLRT